MIRALVRGSGDAGRYIVHAPLSFRHHKEFLVEAERRAPNRIITHGMLLVCHFIQRIYREPLTS